MYEVYTVRGSWLSINLQLSLVIWKRCFFDPIKTRLTSALLSLIEKDRCSEQVDTSLVKGVIDGYGRYSFFDLTDVVKVSLGMISDKPEEYMQVYSQDFNEPFLKASESFYAYEANSFISKNTISDYTKKVVKRIEEEEQRLHTMIHPSSKNDLMVRLDRVLIENHRDSIWQEFQSLLVNDKLEVTHISTMLDTYQFRTSPECTFY